MAIKYLAAGIVFLCLETRPSRALEFQPFPFRVGYIDSNCVFAGDEVINPAPLGVPPEYVNCFLHLWKVPIEQSALSTRPVSKFHLGEIVAKRSPLCWRVAYGCIWSRSDIDTNGSKLVQRIALEDLHCFGEKEKDSTANYSNKHRGQDTNWWLRPVELLDEKGEGDGNPSLDFLPTATDAGLLFLFQHKRLRVWQAKATMTKGTWREFSKLWDVKFTERDDLGFATDFHEPFQVFGDADTWYFMTQSGKLFLCRKPPEGQKRKLELLYADTNSPIKSLITDTVTNKTFAFTAPDEPKNAKGKRVYFELAPKLDPKPYEVKPLTGVKIDYRVKTIWELTQVLVADGKVKAP